MGTSGGVSGYVHSVLVPELAACLIAEDCEVDAEGARKIIADSADLGELLNEEDEESVPRAAGSPAPAYGLA